jgi:GNAT superfamily N-acetyltransferase
MEMRDAVAEDAPAACDVLRRSIAELCVADHRNDPEVLAGWLSNKNPESFKAWLSPGNSVLIAVEDDEIIAVGAVSDAGMITLNYVSPAARFRGVSRALLGALEARAVELGSSQCKLNSTETARRFYRANGYVEEGPPVRVRGVSGYPMSKSLLLA